MKEPLEKIKKFYIELDKSGIDFVSVHGPVSICPPESFTTPRYLISLRTNAF